MSFNVNREVSGEAWTDISSDFFNPDIISSFAYSTKLSLALLFNILH